ncbi:MAG: nuclear transport factor 2 family protein [Chloroflexota bacterium]|nr:nuclear transport factor 2 family protein [Chloroflexota bacterium]
MKLDEPDIAVVQAWHNALNVGNLDRLAPLMHEQIEFVGPRGSGRGAGLVRDWAERAGIQMKPVSWFARGGVIVVAQQARWRDQETGELGEPIDVASVFEVRDGLIQRVARYDSLEEALATVGIDGSEEGSSARSTSTPTTGS